MKMILAMIEPQKLKNVRQALADIGIYNMTVSTAMGCSRNAAPIKERYRGLEQEVYLFKKIRLEIVVNDRRMLPNLKVDKRLQLEFRARGADGKPETSTTQYYVGTLNGREMIASSHAVN